MLLAAVVALVPMAVISASAASAQSSDPWCDYLGGACLQGEGYQQNVIAAPNGNGIPVYNAVNEGSTTWEGHHVWEYQDQSTGYCLEFYLARGNDNVVEANCVAGQASEEWWYSGSDTLVNVYGTKIIGAQACLTGEGVNNPVLLQGCSGAISQVWYQD
jgi:hypothetical protein